MRLALLLLLAACAGETASERTLVFVGDLAKPSADRCAEAQEIAAELPDTLRNQSMVIAACLR